jgi:EAL domain-containing protein (putative c-di-GMP-specific phosphodiesterase class I)
VLIHLGVYEVTDASLEVSVMFDRARIAASSLRNEYHTHIAWYDDRMRVNMLWEQQITGDLQCALTERQIVPYLQPLVDATGKVVGGEALVRWNHPDHGFLPPAKFIPIFERNGMIAEVDRYMWRCACEQLAQWRDNDLFISVNISPKDFYFMDVAAELRGLTKEYGVDPARLRLEITESVMISDVKNKVQMLDGLRAAGFIVEMDDFGSGYSSLNMLKNMPIDVIKIDMMFLRSSGQDEKSMIILRNIINMSTDLNIVPLTEGVETEKQYDDLSRMGCKLFQGYYFAKPMPLEDFQAQYVDVA